MRKHIQKRTVMIYVQHLAGVGHVFRVKRIVDALCDIGFEVHVLYGGAKIDLFAGSKALVHYLPPIRANGMDFSQLETIDGMTIDEAFKANRCSIILSLFNQIMPDALIIEMFPFGRRQMRFELLPLLEAAKKAKVPPITFTSVRDILQENRKSGREMETVNWVNHYFDGVLVHADPKLIELAETFPAAAKIDRPIFHTGIVAADISSQKTIHKYDVVVSVGGGVAGTSLLLATAKAKNLTRISGLKWCFIVGANAKAGTVQALRETGLQQQEIVTFLPDLPAVLSGAQLSISRAGYNTVADILQTKCRAILVPLADNNETEQIKRAQIMQEHQLCSSLGYDEENPETIAKLIDQVMGQNLKERSGVDLKGAGETAAIVMRLLEEKFANDR